jgi:hypothetical protein
LHRLENFENVRKWHLEGLTVNDESEDDDSNEAVSKQAAKARLAYDDADNAKFALACIVELFGNIPSMVAACSAEFDHLQLEVVERLEMLKLSLKMNATKAGAERTAGRLRLSQLREPLALEELSMHLSVERNHRRYFRTRSSCA